MTGANLVSGGVATGQGDALTGVRAASSWGTVFHHPPPLGVPLNTASRCATCHEVFVAHGLMAKWPQNGRSPRGVTCALPSPPFPPSRLSSSPSSVNSKQAGHPVKGVSIKGLRPFTNPPP